jgi:hypothetical protein
VSLPITTDNGLTFAPTKQRRTTSHSKTFNKRRKTSLSDLEGNTTEMPADDFMNILDNLDDHIEKNIRDISIKTPKLEEKQSTTEHEEPIKVIDPVPEPQIFPPIKIIDPVPEPPIKIIDPVPEPPIKIIDPVPEPPIKIIDPVPEPPIKIIDPVPVHPISPPIKIVDPYPVRPIPRPLPVLPIVEPPVTIKPLPEIRPYEAICIKFGVDQNGKAMTYDVVQDNVLAIRSNCPIDHMWIPKPVKGTHRTYYLISAKNHEALTRLDDHTVDVEPWSHNRNQRWTIKSRGCNLYEILNVANNQNLALLNNDDIGFIPLEGSKDAKTETFVIGTTECGH